ncbi:MAG: hypothetical protein COA70_14040 [Planctomycetota bacterium]|nr:MAG: hypothetical protein COA70_14040 [Planctomycetota bacterium]
MESLIATPSLRDRIAPWIEGGLLAIIVMVVVSLSGDAVRTSYHGYLHTSLGEAVLRDGLLPENPYHAGTPLHYYTLYPTLGVLLGKLGGGPLWGFAILNMFAAMLMGPALDAFAKRLGLGFAARRFAFFSMVLGFNGLASWWVSSDNPMVEGASPLLVLLDLTQPMTELSWDGRLQAFLPKFLNVSSFALSLPFAFFALADNLATGKKEMLRMGVLLGITMALNPLVGGFVAILVVLEKLSLLREGLEGVKKLLPAVAVALLISVPFLLPLFAASPEGETTMAGSFPFVGSGAWANLLGPMLLLWPLGIWGLFKMPKAKRPPLYFALGLAALFSFLSLPWSNEYKFPRMEGILLALPVGALLGSLWKSLPGKLAGLILGLLCLPTFLQTFDAYSKWDLGESNLLNHVEDGRLAVRAEALIGTWPANLAAAEKALPSDAVLVFHPWHPGLRGSALGAQGNALMPVLSHSLFVDAPQIHNASLPDLRERLDASFALWQGRRWVKNEQKPSDPYDSNQALHSIRLKLAKRPIAVITLNNHPAVQLLAAAGGSLVAEENGLALWLVPPLEATDEN